MNKLATVLAAVLGCGALGLAQPGAYLGPGILSRGAGDVGYRTGEQVNLRLFADVSGVYDTGLQPFAVDSKGNLITIDALYGVQVDVGAYGSHRWRRAVLGLDYSGNYTHYAQSSNLDTSNQSLKLGYTYQKSRRLSFDFREVAGTSKYGFGSPGFYGTQSTDFVTTPTSLLFDNRTDYLQSTMDVNFIQSARNIFTAGGDGFLVRRQASALAGTNGYNLRGSFQRRATKTRTFGATYEHIHFDFPPAFGESDIDTAELFFSNALSRRFTFSISVGAIHSEVQGIEQVALNPVIAALLGQTFTQRAFYRESVYPSGHASLQGHFKQSYLGIGYSQQITPGNGVYLTSLQKYGNASYTYTGLRNWSLSLNGGYSDLNGIGQGLSSYKSFTGGWSATYRITGALHAIARFDARDQQIDIAGYKHTGYRATIGLAFSPGDIPLSLW